nr:MAG TPA: hypothetical protein [Caudoviricetes sp.]
MVTILRKFTSVNWSNQGFFLDRHPIVLIS